jgi:hypothetical protein
MDAGSLAEIGAARALAGDWLAAHPDDEAVAVALERLSALEDALRAVGLSELPPSTGAR